MCKSKDGNAKNAITVKYENNETVLVWETRNVSESDCIIAFDYIIKELTDLLVIQA